MSYKHCEAEAIEFWRNFCKAFFVGGSASVIFFTTIYLFDKSIEHGGDIVDLFSLLEKFEENRKSSHELKK